MSYNDNQDLESTTSNEELELEINLDDNEEVEAPAEESADRKFARQALARAKKAEAELKTLKEGTKPAPATQLNNDSLSQKEIEIKILQVQGVPAEEIDYLKKLSAVNGTSIIEARTDPFYVSFKEQLEAKAKAEKARLGVSKNGGSVKAEKSFNSQGISDEEHKALWKSQRG
jgi:hypothetical protein